MSLNIAVTGIGLISPLGTDKAQILSALLNNAKLEVRDTSDAHAAQVEKDSDAISNRLIRKIDKFTEYALLAADMAIADRGLNDGAIGPDRIGVFVGNCFGGWGRTDTELRSLYQSGASAVSPYQATAWFPTAPQGQITIRHGYKGFSKTISSDRLSGLMAIGEAARAITHGKIDAAVVGAAEALVTPYISAVLNRRDEEADFSPFNANADVAHAEGAAFLILEDADRAAAEGTKIYGVINGYSSGFCASDCDASERIGGVLKTSLSKATHAANARRLVFLDGVTEAERAAAKKVYPSGDLIEMKTRLGNMFSVSGVMETAIAALVLSGEAAIAGAERQSADVGPPSHAAIHGTAENGCFAALQVSTNLA